MSTVNHAPAYILNPNLYASGSSHRLLFYWVGFTCMLRIMKGWCNVIVMLCTKFYKPVRNGFG